jgi:type III restriction enzyme
VSYRHTSNSVHPTRLTNASGQALKRIDSAAVGTFSSNDSPPDNYLFNEIFYDSPLELDNITSSIQEVIVYSKIPKNSIRIPLVGGHTYSPDFAYVVKGADGNSTLNLVVESKDKTELDLGGDEMQRIKHAEAFFNQMNDKITVRFRKQLQNSNMVNIIKEVMHYP